MPAREFGTHTPCPGPASAFPPAIGNATGCGDVAQPRQGSAPKGRGHPRVLPGCAARAGAQPCCGSCRRPRGRAASPVFTWRQQAAGTSPGSARRSRSPGPSPPQRALLPAAGTARHAACPPWGTATCKQGLEPGWARSSRPRVNRTGHRRPQHAPSSGTAPPCWGGHRGDSPGGSSHPKTRAHGRCPHSALCKDTGAGLSRAVPGATGGPNPFGTTGAPGRRHPQGPGRPRCNRQRFVPGLRRGAAEQRCLCAAQVKRPQAHVGCAMLGAVPGPQGGSGGDTGGGRQPRCGVGLGAEPGLWQRSCPGNGRDVEWGGDAEGRGSVAED